MNRPKTITVTPISGIPTPIEITSIKAVKTLKEVFYYEIDPKEKSKAVIILNADITGELTDELIKVKETVEEIKVMLAVNHSL